MDDATFHHLKALFYEKILGYNDLHRCLQQERAALIDIDMDCLWAISREKEEICREIDGVRQKIRDASSRSSEEPSTSLGQLINGLPAEARAQLQEPYHTILRLKGEIDAMRKENLTYVDSSLQFIDEILSTITGKNRTKTLYNRKCQLRGTTNTVFLSREV
jgi:hypothetical protein